MGQTNTSRQVVEQVRSMLVDLPENPSPSLSKHDVIALLTPEITAARAKGYSLTQIAQKVSEHGIAISTGVLKTYLGESKGRKKRRRSARTRESEKKMAASTGGPLEGQTTRQVNARQAAVEPLPAVKPVVNSAQRTSTGSTISAQPPRKSAFTPRADSDDI